MRGLPPNADLQKPPIARVLSKVLRDGSIPDSTTEDVTALDECYRKGWLHAYKVPNGATAFTCSWNGSCRTSFPQSQLNQTVFFISRSKLSLGSLQTCSPPNEESALDAFSDYRRPNFKTNSTVVVTPIRMDRSLPYLNTVRRKGELIFTYPLKNGVWDFCVTVINLRSTRVGFQNRGRMERLYRCPTTLY